MDLPRAATRWISDGRAQGWSHRTLKDRHQMLDRFCWWLENIEQLPPQLDSLSPTLIRSFLAYLRDPAPLGRWGTDHHASQRETRPSTVQTYYRALRAFSNFLMEEGLLSETPFRNVKTPRVPVDQVEPLTPDQLQALMGAARAGRNPQRDVALVLVLLDTGLRASELCSLIVADADRDGQLSVIGKGNKRRSVYMGTAARRALWQYLESPERRGAGAGEALFTSTGGTLSGAGLTPSGLHSIIQKLGRAARLHGVRCSPHTLRHTFAINFVRGGGNLFELQQLMGHSDLSVLRRYLAIAPADLAEAHRMASPADRLKLK